MSVRIRVQSALVGVATSAYLYAITQKKLWKMSESVGESLMVGHRSFNPQLTHLHTPLQTSKTSNVESTRQQDWQKAYAEEKSAEFIRNYNKNILALYQRITNTLPTTTTTSSNSSSS